MLRRRLSADRVYFRWADDVPAASVLAAELTRLFMRRGEAVQGQPFLEKNRLLALVDDQLGPGAYLL